MEELIRGWERVRELLVEKVEPDCCKVWNGFVMVQESCSEGQYFLEYVVVVASMGLEKQVNT